MSNGFLFCCLDTCAQAAWISAVADLIKVVPVHLDVTIDAYAVVYDIEALVKESSA
jgi:hypothetical protein